MSVFVARRTEDAVKLLVNVWSADDVDISRSFEIDLNVTLPKAATDNSDPLYLYAFIDPTDVRDNLQSPLRIGSGSAPLTRHIVAKTKAMNLLNEERSSGSEDERAKARPTTNEKLVAHWIPHMVVHCMSESIRLYQVPQEMAPYFRYNGRGDYLPLLHVDHFGVLEKDFLEMDGSTHKMPLKISYDPIPFGKMRLILAVKESLQILQAVGFSDKDIDDIKSILFGTNIYLLFLTFLVTGLHMLFAVLAFKNDISFWRNRTTIAGLSLRSMVWRCISQGIVFAYLYDQRTSLLVLVTHGLSVIIEIWKVTKALRLNIRWVGWRPRLELGTVTEEEKMSGAYDSQVMKHLMWLIGPCCVITAAYSLFFTKHISWFSWLLESVVNGVYAFDFIFMMPQLFINYKLKSVEHLPYKVLMYRAFNTFIDDVFAFIISMPTVQRISCFRDDIVFVVYMYQRFLYPAEKPGATEHHVADNVDDKAKKD